ncbi:ATP-binding protein cassette, sub-family F, member 2 [Strigomonas culicis]|nr:ATP-binding protein cassette, sub-family F, member 2 [Strigomonas culicis]|eukprot:EPY37291.1 ATP-binding protein cassette, sub-family F, member 2 [Strigomonas culicis]
MEEIYKRLDELEADTAEARAGKILFGLGFSKDMQRRPTKSFSGGWRMRISLAQALFINPTVLLLDEPTNHLDIEAVVWLEHYLSRFSKILFMVSHSQDFMNNVCTKICHMHIKQLQFYDGNYDQFCVTRSEKESNQMKKYQWEQDQIKNMKEYIARFGHGSAKLARQAQSKEKTLARMTRGGLTDAVVRDNLVRFSFPCAGPLPPPMLQFRDVSFNYPGRPALFEHLDLGVNMDSRICLVGPNGAGKTTLTKLMCRELEPTNGYVSKNAHCVMARFHQHFVDQINMSLTPLEWMGQEYPDITEPTVLRSALGKFGISGKAQMTPMNTLSDGQKSRVVLSWMAFRKPHFMILDEPTNHLDIESIDALAEAINEYEGAVVVVSHDLRLIAQIADEIWIVDEGHAKRFGGDIADYKEHVEKQVEAMMQTYSA